MRKFILLMLLIVMFLSGCTELSLDYLDFKLNPGNDTIEINSEFMDAGAKANYGFRDLEVVVIYNDLDLTKKGVYEIVYQTTYKTLVQTLVRKVTVVDQTPPLVTLKPGVDTVLVTDNWIDAGIQVYDNSLDDVKITVIGEVINEVGRYEILYEVIDSSGNKSEVVRIVYVIEE